MADYAVSMFTRFAVTTVARDTVTDATGRSDADGRQRDWGRCCWRAVIAAIVGGGLQSGFRLSPEAFGLQIRKSPAQPAGFRRVFSKAAVVRGGIDLLLKLTAIGMALWAGAKRLAVDPLFSSPIEVAYLAQFLQRATQEFFGRLLLSLGVIAAIGYSYERFKTSKDLMMTKQEIKDERKNSEGSGLTKGAQRRLGRRLMQKQMLAAVATADVVSTNPTHSNT